MWPSRRNLVWEWKWMKPRLRNTGSNHDRRFLNRISEDRYKPRRNVLVPSNNERKIMKLWAVPILAIFLTLPRLGKLSDWPNTQWPRVASASSSLGAGNIPGLAPMLAVEDRGPDKV